MIRDVDSLLSADLDHLCGNHIAAGKNAVNLRMLLQNFFNIFMVLQRGVQRVRFLFLQVKTLQPLLAADLRKAQRPVVRRHQLRVLPAQINHFPAALFSEMFCDHSSPLAVITLDCGSPALQKPFDRHKRHTEILKPVHIYGTAAQDDTCHADPSAHLQIFDLFIVPFIGIKDHQLIFIQICGSLQTAQQP